jgi:hypothetical protein
VLAKLLEHEALRLAAAALNLLARQIAARHQLGDALLARRGVLCERLARVVHLADVALLGGSDGGGAARVDVGEKRLEHAERLLHVAVEERFDGRQQIVARLLRGGQVGRVGVVVGVVGGVGGVPSAVLGTDEALEVALGGGVLLAQHQGEHAVGVLVRHDGGGAHGRVAGRTLGLPVEALVDALAAENVAARRQLRLLHLFVADGTAQPESVQGKATTTRRKKEKKKPLI